MHVTAPLNRAQVFMALPRNLAGLVQQHPRLIRAHIRTFVCVCAFHVIEGPLSLVAGGRGSGNPARRDMSQSILCVNIRYCQECEAKGFSKAKNLKATFFVLTYHCKLKKKKICSE